mmetsp:Transcript_22723/g.44273  ORF Transcript_22723/g.44273 Transcript_22723/m.44273 type:complete len:371 (+) Transcript_22723:3346-4458(+)
MVLRLPRLLPTRSTSSTTRHSSSTRSSRWVLRLFKSSCSARKTSRKPRTSLRTGTSLMYGSSWVSRNWRQRWSRRLSARSSRPRILSTSKMSFSLPRPDRFTRNSSTSSLWPERSSRTLSWTTSLFTRMLRQRSMESSRTSSTRRTTPSTRMLARGCSTKSSTCPRRSSTNTSRTTPSLHFATCTSRSSRTLWKPPTTLARFPCGRKFVSPVWTRRNSSLPSAVPCTSLCTPITLWNCVNTTNITATSTSLLRCWKRVSSSNEPTKASTLNWVSATANTRRRSSCSTSRTTGPASTSPSCCTRAAKTRSGSRSCTCTRTTASTITLSKPSWTTPRCAGLTTCSRRLCTKCPTPRCSTRPSSSTCKSSHFS